VNMVKSAFRANKQRKKLTLGGDYGREISRDLGRREKKFGGEVHRGR